MNPRGRRPVLLLAIALAIAVWVWLRHESGEPGSDSDRPAGQAAGGRPQLRARSGPKDGTEPDEQAAAAKARTPKAEPARGAGRIHVTVRRADGNPQEGYLVEVFAPEGGGAPPPRRTDAKGEAQFADLPALDGYVLRVSEPGKGRDRCFEAHRTVDLARSPAGVVVFEIPRTSIAGRVIDGETRKAVPDATVRAVAMEVEVTDEVGGYSQTHRVVPERVVVEVRSDAEGKFLLVCDQPLVEVEATAPGGRRGTPDPNRRPVGGEIVVEVWLRESVVVKGRVVDDRDQPVPGATLSFRVDDRSAASATALVTDPEGDFTLEATQPYYRVAVKTRDGRELVTPLWIERDTTEVRIVIPLTTALAITVTDESSGDPVPDAELRVWGYGPHAEVARTDATGKARIAFAPGTVGSIDVRAPGYSRDRVRAPEFEGSSVVVAQGADLVSALSPGEVREVALRLRRGGVVTGRVVFRDGAPAARVLVAADDWGFTPFRPTTQSDEAGRFRLEIVPPEDPLRDRPLAVRALLDGYVSALAALDAARLRASGGVQDVGDLVLDRIGVVRGRVVDADGAPVARAKLFMEYAPAGDEVHTQTDGSFAIGVGALMGKDSVPTVLFAAEGFLEKRVPVDRRPAPGGTTEIGSIVLTRASARKIRVVDADGRAVPGMRVLAQSDARARDAESAPRTDANGYVVLERVEGHFTLWRDDGAKFSFWDLDVRDGSARDLVIRIPATRPLECRVVDETGSLVPFSSLVLTTHGGGRDLADIGPFLRGDDDSGAFSFGALPAAEFDLEVSASGFVTRVVIVRADAPSRITIVLERFGEAHRVRLAEIRDQIRLLKPQVDRDPPGMWDDRHRRLYELEQEARRLTGR